MQRYTGSGRKRSKTVRRSAVPGETAQLAASFSAPVCCNKLLASDLFFETTGDEQGAANFWPFGFRKAAYHRSDSITLRESDVVKVQRGQYRHAIILRQHNFGRDAADGARYWHNNDFIQVLRY